MKHTLSLIALVAICCAMMASCKNNKQSEPTPEEIQAQKVALADSVLVKIDAINEDFLKASEESFIIGDFILTKEEKMAKPDYLLDLSFASTLLTKSPKVNALGIYLVDLLVRKAYDMPLEETKEVMTKLAVELNLTVNTDFEMPVSEKIKQEYEACRERGDLTYFWQFQHAIVVETSYVISQNPELFFGKITEEQWQAYTKKTNEHNKAIRELAKYDKEMADVLELFNQTRVYSSDEEKTVVNTSIESAKQFRIANKDKFIAHRNALLQ